MFGISRILITYSSQSVKMMRHHTVCVPLEGLLSHYLQGFQLFSRLITTLYVTCPHY